MSKITTEDCKKFLIKQFENLGVSTLTNDWKRTSKYKIDNLWHRDFLHPVVGQITILEKNGELELLTTSNTLNNSKIDISDLKIPSEYIQKLFTNVDIKGAKKLIDTAIRNDYDEGITGIVVDPLWNQFSHALPSQFTFNFPEQTYFNDDEYCKNGRNIDLPLRFTNADEHESFCVSFYDRKSSNIEFYSQDLLRENILPIWLDFVDESCASAMNNSPSTLTVRDFFKMLINLGFEYQSKDCFFAQELQKLKIDKQTIQNDPIEKTLKEICIIKNILRNDEYIALAEMIKKGLDVNNAFNANGSMLYHAFDLKASQCFKLLLDSGATIWHISEFNKHSVVFDIFEKMYDVKSKFYSDLIFNKMLEQAHIALNNESELFNIFKVFCLNLPKPIVIDMYNTFSKLFSNDDVDKLILTSVPELQTNYKDLLSITLKRCSSENILGGIEYLIQKQHWDLAFSLIKHKQLNFNDFSNKKIDGISYKEYLEGFICYCKNEINPNNKTIDVVIMNNYVNSDKYDLVKGMVKAQKIIDFLNISPVNKPKI